MNIKHKDLLIPTEQGSNPFLNCKLDRSKYADILTEIISNYADGFVLAVNNEWGSGKTTFINMWRQSLNNQDYKTLYYNAWENDFEKDVLVALIAEMQELEDEAKEAFKSVLDKAAPLTVKILPALAKSIAGKYIGDDFVKELVNGFAEVTSEGLKNEIQVYTDRKKSLKDFRNSLEKFAAEASPDKPLIFFIDELDRCRPNYAVEVLETVKHLFSVKGIVFVISIDKEQLAHAVKGVYGSESIDANEYLRRFIDLEYQIPRPNIQNFVDYLYEYFKFQDFLDDPSRQTQSEFRNNQNTFKSIANLLFIKGHFRLRQIEKIFAKIRLILKGFSVNHYVFPEIILFLAFIQEKHPIFWKKLKTHQLSIQDFVNEMDVVIKPIYKDSLNVNQILSLYASMLWRFYLENYDKNPSIKQILIDDSVPENIKLSVNSYFESKGLIKALEYQRNQHNNSDLGLSWILERYNFTSNFQS